MIKVGSKFFVVCIIEERQYFTAQVETTGTILQQMSRNDFIARLTQAVAKENRIPVEQVKAKKIKFF